MTFDLTPTAAQHDLARRAHEFAESVIRPVALDYDQRQEFPWPVLEEAAQRGFYSPLFYRDLIGDPTGISLPMFMEELFWGCAGIGLAIVMPALALSAIGQAASPEQMLQWAPECFGTPGDLKLAALAISGALHHGMVDALRSPHLLLEDRRHRTSDRSARRHWTPSAPPARRDAVFRSALVGIRQRGEIRPMVSSSSSSPRARTWIAGCCALSCCRRRRNTRTRGRSARCSCIPASRLTSVTTRRSSTRSSRRGQPSASSTVQTMP